VISMFGFVGAVGVSRYVSRADLRTTARYRRMHRRDTDTGLIGTVEGIEPSVPELAVELEEARLTDPDRAARMEGRETELEASSLRVHLDENGRPREGTSTTDPADAPSAGSRGGSSAEDRESGPRHEAVADSDSQSSDADHREDDFRRGD